MLAGRIEALAVDDIVNQIKVADGGTIAIARRTDVHAAVAEVQIGIVVFLCGK